MCKPWAAAAARAVIWPIRANVGALRHLNWEPPREVRINWDLAAVNITNSELVIELAEAAQRALSGRVTWTPVWRAAAVREAAAELTRCQQ